MRLTQKLVGWRLRRAAICQGASRALAALGCCQSRRLTAEDIELHSAKLNYTPIQNNMLLLHFSSAFPGPLVHTSCLLWPADCLSLLPYLRKALEWKSSFFIYKQNYGHNTNLKIIKRRSKHLSYKLKNSPEYWSDCSYVIFLVLLWKKVQKLTHSTHPKGSWTLEVSHSGKPNPKAGKMHLYYRY